MNKNQAQRLKLWSFVGTWVFIIYSTLYIVRPICNFLKSHIAFNLFANIIMFCLLWSIIIFFLVEFEIRKKSTYALLAFIALIYMYGFIFLVEFPEEKIHLVEYGFLAVLVYRALVVDFNDLFSYFMAFVITALLGWGDEGIQYILPNRYYQTQDVILNLISGGLGLFFMFAIQREIYAKNKKFS